MSKEIQKVGYCVSCDENVPHQREKANGLREFVDDLLQKLQLGRWHCVQCQSSRYFLPFADEGTVDYQIYTPSDPVNPSKLNIGSRLEVDGDEFARDQRLIHGSVQETLPAESSNDALRGDLLDPFDFSKKDVFCQKSEDDLFGEAREGGIVLEAVGDNSDGGNSKVESQQSAGDEAPEAIVAEPVGNFIKDQSLVIEVTRLKRFTEKYRDALVERILSGKAQVSRLIADGKYTEAELVSWIADKARRQAAEQGSAIELDAFPRRHK